MTDDKGKTPKPRARRRKKADEPEAAAKAPKADAKAAKQAEDKDAEKAKPARRRRKPAAAKAETTAAEKPAGDKGDKADKAATDRQEAPAKPKPARRRRDAEPGAAAPLVRARARYVRSSARKARLVCEHIRGKSVEEARAILAFTPRAVARDWSKLLDSAVANAENNHELVGDDLRIRDVYADEGPTLKRYRPRAMGRATRINKRTSHLTITLTPKE